MSEPLQELPPERNPVRIVLGSVFVVISVAVAAALNLFAPPAATVLWPIVNHPAIASVVVVAAAWLGIAIWNPGGLRGLAAGLLGLVLTLIGACSGFGMWVGLGSGAEMRVGTVVWRTAQYAVMSGGSYENTIYATALYRCDRFGWICTKCLENDESGSTAFRVEMRGADAVLFVGGELVTPSTAVACHERGP